MAVLSCDRCQDHRGLLKIVRDESLVGIHVRVVRPHLVLGC